MIPLPDPRDALRHALVVGALVALAALGGVYTLGYVHGTLREARTTDRLIADATALLDYHASVAERGLGVCLTADSLLHERGLLLPRVLATEVGEP
jgi:hypothetical protein